MPAAAAGGRSGYRYRVMAAIWQRDRETEPRSYLKEVVTHQWSLYGLLGALALGTLLAFPYGFKLAALPLLGFAAVEAIAALFLPSSAWFRHWVDAKNRRERREQARAHLLNEIRLRVAEDPLWALYDSLCERLISLHQMVYRNSLGEGDLERLEDATVDFLGLWLGRLTMLERLETMDEADLKRRLKALSAQLEVQESETNRKHLRQAKADLDRILTRRQRLVARQAAADAAMLALADTFDEIYQAVMTNPTSGELAGQLQEAVERLHIEEDLDLGLEDTIDVAALEQAETHYDDDHPHSAKPLRLRAREPRG